MTDWTFFRVRFQVLVPWLEFREWPEVEKRTLRSRLRALRVHLTKPDEIHETPCETPQRLARVHEALELVGLALHYGRDAWQEFAFLNKKLRNYKNWSHFRDVEDRKPRFELAFNVAHFEQFFGKVDEPTLFEWDMHLCKRLLQLPPEELSREYDKDRARIIVMAGSSFDPSCRLEMQFVFMPPRQKRHIMYTKSTNSLKQFMHRHRYAVVFFPSRFSTRICIFYRLQPRLQRFLSSYERTTFTSQWQVSVHVARIRRSNVAPNRGDNHDYEHNGRHISSRE